MNVQPLSEDLIHLARVALSGRAQDVQTLLHRIVKRRRESEPDVSDALSKLLRESPTRSSPLRRQTASAVPVDVDSRMQLLRIEEQPYLDHEPVFSPYTRDLLRRLVDERRGLESLQQAGLEPTRTSLFTGPPGVGKTMAARWLARELQKPLVILDLSSVMSSFLGRTGANVRQVLDYAKSIDCVLLLDELDAVAKRRDDRSEIGELKRLVTVLLQQFDDWPSSGLLVAATNHSDLLDPAVWRRFEMIVEFSIPTTEAAANFIDALLIDQSLENEVWPEILASVWAGKSFSDIELNIKSALRSSAIYSMSLDEAFLSMIHIDSLDKKEKIDIAVFLVASGLLSQRKAHEITGVARETIRSRINK